MNQSDHLTAGQIARYLDHDLDLSLRGIVESHLDSCTQCRAELAESAKLADSWFSSESTVSQRSRPRIRKWPTLAAGGVLAAAVALIVLTGRQSSNIRHNTPAVRTSAFGEGRTRLSVILPASDSVAAGQPVKFVWHSSAGTVYRLTLLSETGEPLYTAETGDTSLSVPDTVHLSAGRNYFWRVDGLGNGMVSTTGATLLRIGR